MSHAREFVSLRLVGAAAAAVVASFGIVSHVNASPYASGISNSGGNVTFTLNEDAGDVTAIVNGTPTDLGALTRGTHSFGVGTATNYSIVVSKLSGPGYNLATGTVTITDGVTNNPPGPQPLTSPMSTPLQISDDTNLYNQFFAPRGVVIDNNPLSPRFGRIYVSNANTGLTSGGRIQDRGIYVMNADQTGALSQASDPSNPPLVGGDPMHALPFGTASTAAPWRIELGQDGNLYMSDDTTDGGTLYVTDPDVATGTLVLAGRGSANATGGNHGRIMSSPIVTGSLAGGNLLVTAVDADLQHANGSGTLEYSWINQWAVGSGPNPSTVTPTFLPQNPTVASDSVPNVTIDLDKGPDGKWYLMQNRSQGLEAGLFVLSPDGTKVLWDSKTVGNVLRGNPTYGDILFQTRSGKVTADGKNIVLITDNNRIWVIPLINGIPDLVNRKMVSTTPTTTIGRDISVDIAGNIYTASSGQGLLRIYSPGGPSVVTYNSDGTVKVQNNPEFTAASGNYSTTGNWLMGYVPNAISETALFNTTGGGAKNVTLDVPVTLGNLYFDGTAKTTIGGASTLTLSSYGEPRIQTYNGSHEISAPVVVNQNLQITTNAGSSLRVSGPVSYAPAATSLTKAGTGSLEMVNYRVPTLNVNEGTAKVIGGGGNNSVSNVQNLNIAGTTDAWTAKLDLNNSALVVDYPAAGPTVLPTVQNQIKNGYAGGAWTGNGITSSAAAANSTTAHKTALGYVDSTSPGTFLGQTLDGSAVLVRYVYSGDANIDGTVDTVDFNALASNFGGTGKVWNQADFNYDGVVDTQDFNLLASNFGQQLSDSGGGAGALVPEPTSIALLGLGAAALVARRRRASR